MIRNQENFLSFYVEFSFVRYSVYIIFRVVIHVSSEKKLAVVRATRVVCTIEYISCIITSDQQRVSSYLQTESVFDSANIPGIL